jgi:AcrR family transcriptional regulator
MARRPRTEMIAETRSKLVAAGRQAFGTIGYAEASMDDFTAAAGLTRGALYHHFGDKRGLFTAVVAEIDAEMTRRMEEMTARSASPWQAFVDECVAYIEMAMDPEIRRIIHCDGPAVLGDPALWPIENGCIASMTQALDELRDDGVIIAEVDPEATARLVNGATIHAAQWIASSDDPRATSKKAVAAFKAMLNGLLAG